MIHIFKIIYLNKIFVKEMTISKIIKEQKKTIFISIFPNHFLHALKEELKGNPSR